MAMPCIFREVTGLPCPSCGSTRAVLALARLDVARAMRLSPISVVAASMLGSRRRSSRSAPSLELIAVIILALGLARALLVAFEVRTPFTSEHIDWARVRRKESPR